MTTQTQIQYNRKLQQIVKLVRDDVNAELVPLVKQQAPDYVQDAQYVETYHAALYDLSIPSQPRTIQDAYWSGTHIYMDSWPDIIAAALRRLLARWTSPFAQKQAQDIATQFVRTSLDDNLRRSRSVGIDLYGGNQELQDYMSAAAFQNANLIKSIPVQYLEQVQNIVMGNMRQGMRPSYIEQQLVKQFGVTTRRAKLIARDQTSKIQGEMNRIRQVNSGLEYFQWITSHDERVRHSHTVAGDKVTAYGKGVYKWSDLPIVDGVPSYPGSAVQCRCIAKPVTETQVERNKKAGKTDPSVKR